jgi:hypothetical protein
MNFDIYEDVTVECNHDDSIILIDFNRNNNFLIIVPMSINEYTHNEIIQYEKCYLTKLEYKGRSGSAGGLVFPNTNSHSLSNVTRKESTIFSKKQEECRNINCVPK